MSTTVTLKRGATLDHVLDIGTAVSSCEAWLGNSLGGKEVTDLGASVSGNTAVVAYVTTPLKRGKYYYDVKAVDGTGKIHTGKTYTLIIEEPQTKP